MTNYPQAPEPPYVAPDNTEGIEDGTDVSS